MEREKRKLSPEELAEKRMNEVAIELVDEFGVKKIQNLTKIVDKVGNRLYLKSYGIGQNFPIDEKTFDLIDATEKISVSLKKAIKKNK